jgi:hypothetical protein
MEPIAASRDGLRATNARSKIPTARIALRLLTPQRLPYLCESAEWALSANVLLGARENNEK